MDRERRKNQLLENKNSKIYLDLKDIVMEHALPFLPAKSLFRFTGVCTYWKLEITTPFFAHKQSNGFRDISGFFYQSKRGTPSFMSLEPNAFGLPDPSLKFLPEPVDVLASSNGLLCCQGREGYRAYYICNPVTKKWTKLPKPNADHGSDPAIVLVFEPTLLNFVAEYKLVCAFQSADFDGGYEFEIYSSRDGSWRVSGEIFFGNKHLVPRSGIHVMDIIYWQLKCSQILVFDLKAERTTLQYGNSAQSCLGVMDGKLCSTKPNSTGLHVSVLSNAFTNTMQMDSCAQAWVNKHHINLPLHTDISGLRYPHTTKQVLIASGNAVVFRQSGKVHWYDLKTKHKRCLGDDFDHDAECVSYVNSLVEI